MLGQKAPVGTRACAGVGESSAMDGIDRRLLESHHARVKSDSAFQSALRLMQALWRESRDLPLGQANGKPMGSALAMPVAQEKLLNFLTPAIGELATTAAPDASPRLYENLLSSQPLCFNLFGELALDVDLATAVARQLWPDDVDQVTSVEFGWSPSGEGERPADAGAFDVVMFHSTPAGGTGFVAFKVKYHENMRVKVLPHAEVNDDIARRADVFASAEFALLASPPLQQIWLSHLLGLSMIESDGFDVGRVVVTAPSINDRCAAIVADYGRNLVDHSTFESLTLEQLVDTIAQCTNARWVWEFRNRYLDYTKVPNHVGRLR